MSALRTYVDYLLALACELETEIPENPQINDPANFFQAFLRVLDKKEKTTRRGVDTAIEAVFTHSDMTPLLDDVTAVTFQRRFVVEQFPLCSQLFRSYWSHVITAAWDQLRDAKRMMLYTEQ